MLKFLLILSFYLPFQIALNPMEGIDLASIRVFILLLFFIWLAKSLKQKELIITSSPQTYLISSFLFLSLFSSFFAQNTDWSMRKLLFLFSVFPIYFIVSAVINSEAKRIKTIKTLVISGALASLVGVTQFFLQFIIGIDSLQKIWATYFLSPFLGKSFSQAVLTYPSWLVDVSGTTYFRAISFFPDPHMFSLFLGLLLPLSLGLFFIKRKKLWLFSSGLILLANILTFSRGAYLGLTVGILFLFFIFQEKIGKKYKLLFAFGSLILLSTFLVPNPVSSRFFSTFNLKEGSNIGRIEIWEKTGQTILKYPLTGTGIGNFPLEINPSATYREPIYAHNTYLDIAVETGILASFVWIGVLFFSIASFLKKAKENLLYLCAALSLVIFAAHSLVETGIYSPVVLTLLLIIMALSNIRENEKIS